VPLLASAVLVYGLVADPPTVAEHIGKLFASLPRDAASLIADQLKSLTDSPKSAKGLSLVVAVALAVYGASKGASGVVTALNIAYEVKESRGFVKTTLLSLAMTVGGLLVLLLAGIAMSASAAIESLLPFSSGAVHFLLQALFWSATVVAVAVGLAAVYRFAPSRPDAPWLWVSPGSAAATLLWLAGTIGFGLYVTNFGSYNKTYGSLGGVVVFLTWLYLTAYIILMGGELNSELERQQAMEAKSAPVALPAPEHAPLLAAPPATDAAAPPRRRLPIAAALLGGLVALRLIKRREKTYARLYSPEPTAPRRLSV
jgi:membrane protein